MILAYVNEFILCIYKHIVTKHMDTYGWIDRQIYRLIDEKDLSHQSHLLFGGLDLPLRSKLSKQFVKFSWNM